MASESLELAEARAGVQKAIQNYANVFARERHDFTDVIIEGWAAAVEYTCVELVQDDRSGHLNIVPNDQPRAMSIGLMTIGWKEF